MLDSALPFEADGIEANARAMQALMRENARLRGDLMTIARRISHDLRTPIGGILTTGELVTEILAEADASRAALTQPIFQSAEVLRMLVDRVSFVTMASAKPVSKTRLAMKDVFWSARQRLENQIWRKAALIVEPDSWPEAHGVESWVETVWWNLLANALQHGGKTVRIELSWQEREGEYRFWICDNGEGVPKESRNKLFQPFHSLHERDATRGLGLSIVQRLMELQNGHCGYEPGLQGGSRFYFALPIEESTLHAARLTPS